ncbi:MAG: formate--phosphoribosylaminoimidazolecarboxamide ligase [Candidatus Aenigmarchaeota archaeon]|nr:formate--phosphoribosylaminoimidazolecarboxamide ligase [Candidatus Aenigmarchaeota archaeon]
MLGLENTSEKAYEILRDYDFDNLVIATICSHTDLQLNYGAKQEGFKTLGIVIRDDPDKKKKFYQQAFPKAIPEYFIEVDSYKDILKPGIQEELIEKNTIIVPHGSFVEYVGADDIIKDVYFPVFGNKRALPWESNRKKERIWLEGAGLSMPKKIKKPEEIDGPAMIKRHGAKGGKDFFVVKSPEEFFERMKNKKYKLKDLDIQEFVMGTRYYPHFFYSPIQKNSPTEIKGYESGKGILQLMSMDRRDETTIDEVQRLGSIRELEEYGIHPTFVVTGNIPIVMRESLLPKLFCMANAVIEKADVLFGGIPGPLCLETVVDENLNFRTFEISARIVAGTNPFVPGSPYSVYIDKDLSTGRRIAQEIKFANNSYQEEKDFNIWKEIIS